MSADTRIRKIHIRILNRLDSMLESAKDSAFLALRRDLISAWNVGEHLQHLTLVDSSILRRLEAANPPAEMAGKGPTLAGRCMLLTGYIPRGTGKAPAFVIPRDIRGEEVRPALSKTRERFAALDLAVLAADGALARHHAFGFLNGLRWLRFVDLHHHHHWKIIGDIQQKM